MKIDAKRPSALRRNRRATESEIEEQENDVATHRSRLDEVDTRINEARAEVQRLQNQIASHRNRIDFNFERARELSEFDRALQGGREDRGR